MYVISNYQVNFAIKNFVNQEVCIGARWPYPTVLGRDRLFMEQFLNRFYHGFSSLFEDKNEASRIFINRLKRIDVVRLDSLDVDFPPFKFAYEQARNDNGEYEGGAFIPSLNGGVILLALDFGNKSKKEAVLTLIHELIHAMSLIKILKDNEMIYKCGIHGNWKNLNKINEGIVEYISRIVWSEMYKFKTCPDTDRYVKEMDLAKRIINLFPSENQFIQTYFDDGRKIEDMLKCFNDDNNINLFQYLNETRFSDLTKQKSLINFNFSDKKIEN